MALAPRAAQQGLGGSERARDAATCGSILSDDVDAVFLYEV